MRRILIILIALLSLGLNGQDIGGQYYVATTGSDDNAGTYAAPFATWQKAVSVAEPGDTVYIRGGTYYPQTPARAFEGGAVLIAPDRGYGNNGTRNAPICYFAYPGEVPILDCSQVDDNDFNFASGISIDVAEWIVFKGLIIQNVWQLREGRQAWGIGAASSANLRFEEVTVRNIGGRGFYYNSGAWTEADGENPPFATDSTYWINCDAYELCDTFSLNPGNSADGWKCHAYRYNLLSWYGCRAWKYSDDGFDPSGGCYRIFDRCWAMNTQLYAEYDMEGNGFKTNTPYFETDENLVIFRNCIAAHCNGIGLYVNLSVNYVTRWPNQVIGYNNTLYDCDIAIQDFGVLGYERTSTYRNNLTYGSRSSSYDVAIYRPSVYDESNNTWIATQSTDYDESWPGWVVNPAYTVTDDDFVSLDSTLFWTARNADGSLPDIDFLKLAPGSDLIDGGTDVGLPYNGLAPDLGAFESGESETSDATDIVTFTLSSQTGTATINTTNHTVSIQVEYGTDITSLSPTITLSYGATIDPASGAARNFTTPQTYTVTAEDGVTEQEWTVTVTVASAPSVSQFIKIGSKFVKSIRGNLIKK